MFSSRIATAAVVALIGVASVPLVSGCHSTTGSTSSAAPSAVVYGDPAAVAKYWRQQSLEDNCGLMSVADVVGEITGNEPTEQQMITLAQNTSSGTNPGPIYASSTDPSHADGNGGVEMADLVVLLDHYGVKSAMYWTAHPETTGLPALQQYLRVGRKAIAWVNSAVIWNTSDQRTKADHYLVVTGIDTNKKVVHLNDPGADHPDEQVSITTFTNAWRTGEESIVVTMPAS
ncbi:C39 family peptidase [Mycobacterium sp. Dal123C01]|uniref:C39 family peptidase n=1 Tax=Mycobacterium sp. Dal123C01 TaxID=3457577 RepID=UPI00403E9DC1